MQKNETESPLLSAFSQGILTLTFNRPEARNALSPEITSGLIVALEEAQRDADVRAVVITGSGRAFCAGGDVKAMATSQAQSMNLAERQRLLRQRADASRLLHEMPKPSIAVLPGAAAGAGLALALACDFRIAARSAKISTAFAKVGLSGDYGMSYFLPRIVGEAKARELLMFSPVLGADEAHALGLLHQVHDDETLQQAATSWIETLAQGPTLAYGHIKKALLASSLNGLSTQLDVESGLQVLCQSTEDHKEAAIAFVEKRAARFQGR
ncbi:MAG: enoyl-CoA hydratase [Betaproteobacteria bacterium]|nr:enoyl-CoA hydratase [Betaproteobacteria bacterium]